MSTTTSASAPSTAASAADGITPTPGSARLYRRIVRRETHASRSGLAITLAVLLVIVFAWIGTEIVLALLGAPALLAAPADMFGSTLHLVDAPTWIVATAGILVALLGLVLIVLAISPGRRARHVLASDRAAVVVDNEVVASALARHAALAADVDPDNTSVAVSHRSAVVSLVPTSGIPVDRSAVQQTVDERLADWALTPALRGRVRVAPNGRIGA